MRLLMKLLVSMRRVFIWIGTCVGYIAFYGFLKWLDYVRGFFFMVRSENIDRWKRAEDERFRHQKAHLDDLRVVVPIKELIGGRNGNN